MQRQPAVITGVVGVIVVASWTLLAAAQLPLAPVGTRGQTITPVYEGWFPNPDGTFSMSWGYFNRNSAEIIQIPIGADNRIERSGPDSRQPTHFLPRRQRGVFTVVVRADFGDKEVSWTLTFRGDTQTIPGHLHRDWMLDALGGGAGGDSPPVVKFAENGPDHRGPGNPPEGPLTATVGTPLPLVVWATDDGIRRRRGNEDSDDGPPPLVTLKWHVHQGPGEATFVDEELEIMEDGDQQHPPKRPSPLPSRASICCGFLPTTGPAAAVRSAAGPTRSCG